MEIKMSEKIQKCKLETINNVKKAIFIDFYENMHSNALESEKFKENKKALQEEIDLELNKDTIDKEVIEAKRLAMETETLRHKSVQKDLNDKIKDDLKIIPDSLYESYKEYVQANSKDGYRNAIIAFMDSCEILSGEKGYTYIINRTIRGIGLKLNGSKGIVDGGSLTTVLNKQAFKKMFMAVFYDILVENKVVKEDK